MQSKHSDWFPTHSSLHGGCPHKECPLAAKSHHMWLCAGLTSRPEQKRGDGSRYSLAAQADLTLQLCAACGVRRVVLAGHADGALLALMAAAAASR